LRVLVAEDDAISRRLLEINLSRFGYQIVSTSDGEQAWQAFEGRDPPSLAVLDWMMPGMDGLDLCRRIRADEERLGYVYMVMLTAKSRHEDRVHGFRAGVDDYLTKPFDPQDLRARMEVGRRIIELQNALQAKVRELEAARGHVRELQGLLPICMFCKKIRDDASIWHQLEAYIAEHSGANFTHSLCEECLRSHYPGLVDKDPVEI
jgi:DNA-binding response OmpR family regulator